MFCHNCGIEILKDRKFCTKCGAKVELSERDNEAFAKDVQQSVSEGVCVNCGKKLSKLEKKLFKDTCTNCTNEKNKKCQYCGVKLTLRNRAWNGFCNKCVKGRNIGNLINPQISLKTGCITIFALILFIIVMVNLVSLKKKHTVYDSQESSTITDMQVSSSEQDGKKVIDKEMTAIQEVKIYKLPNGHSIEEQIKTKENLNYGNGNWFAYKPNKGSDCPISAESQYADWIVCFKTAYVMDGHKYTREPTWRLKDEKAYPLNGTASQATGVEVPPLAGYASYSASKQSKENDAPTQFECSVGNELLSVLGNLEMQIPDEIYLNMSEEEIEEIENRALKKTAKKFGITPEKVDAINKKITEYQSRSQEIACPH